MTLEEIDTEIVELSNQITILDRQIANMKLSGETNTLSYRRNLIAVKAARQLKNALQQDRRRLANEQGVKKAQEIKVPTFNYHFYHVAKEFLSSDKFEQIKIEAHRRFEEESEHRGFTA